MAVQFTGTIMDTTITCKQFLEFHAKNTHEPLNLILLKWFIVLILFSFSSTCEIRRGQLICTNCTEGYTGTRCES